MLRAVTLDYWDTIYLGASVPARIERRQEALWHMLTRDLGVAVDRAIFEAAYLASRDEAHRWWRDEQRGYTAEDRIRWLLARLGVERPADCDHVKRAAAVVDSSLLDVPAPLLDGARSVIPALAAHYRLAIISDTGFASGDAQDALLAQDGLREHFDATIYSVDVGVAKPRPAIFEAALRALGCQPHEVLHVGDNERTDVAGALGMGMRAVRIDAVRRGVDPSKAEHVVHSLTALSDYLLIDNA